MNNFKDYGMMLLSRAEGRPGGELGVFLQDAPSFHIIDSTVYHTDMDNLNVVPANGLEQSAHVGDGPIVTARARIDVTA